MKREIKYIVVHCTASPQSQTVESIKNYWKNTLKWSSPGYHRLIDASGEIHNLSHFDKPTNGVKGFNASSIHISYIGGVDSAGKAIDNRTPAQKAAIITCIKEALEYVGKKVKILGHRDFSPDKNGNGRIDPFERIKECPCFDAIPEYEWITK